MTKIVILAVGLVMLAVKRPDLARRVAGTVRGAANRRSAA
jgi:hypothetical protein